ncbi:allophanate hydrolase [Carbonactinospora thermoautotrophica]|uniref:5-oxoprolinase subunit C family protein n=1 Tax=Carbonactinospora thermoautotrophica TaxID=1469144 RepID=UPI00226E9120|nr:biotin-dependent carboxyltransferase family protein [Carbonactinospora thermoautotrophica]MCX9189940.1 allophanate hydrolase [Carbonactinospora thermoautotrophica]
MAGEIEVLKAGPLTTVQDLGRPGYADLGIGESGAADRRSFTLANRLVGNAEGAAALECTLGGLAVRFTRHTTVALTGAPAPARLDGRPVGLNAPVQVAAGQVLRLGLPAVGLRTYLAVRGGVAVPPVAGSRSCDLLSGIGPAVLRDGDRLPVGDETVGLPVVDVAPVPPLPAGEMVLRVVLGPRHDWFTPAAVATLLGEPYEVTSESNRIGARLHGPPLDRAREGELPSEGMVTGALQVPPSGQPVLFLADHPVTGGYPVIGVVVSADIPLAAQARPGQWLRFQVAR